ncbi:unnamed protein product [Ectocarpus sp. 13 AM-2016]
MESGNIPSHVYDQIVAYAKGCTVRFVGSQERGEEKRNLHMQCVGTWALMKTFDTPTKLNAAMRKHIRDKSGIASNDRIKIVVKPLEGKQTFTDMVGYCCKDSGKGHYKTFRKNVTKAEANTALTEYRALQRQTVKDNRVEWGKENFWSILHRFKQENIRALTVSPQLAAQWLVNDGEYLPSYSWICPTGNSGMVSEAADAYWVALLTPKLFTRKHAYVLFFSGGYSGRTTSSFALWDNIDREFEELSVDEAKVCSHDRLRVQGAMDLARERAAREMAAYRHEPDGVLRFAVDRDSDEHDPLPAAPGQADCPAPRAVATRERLSTMVRTATDNSAASEPLPLLVYPNCVEAGCTKAGNGGMVTCFSCDGQLHRACGTLVNEDNPESTDRRCSSCVSAGKGKRKAPSPPT